MSTVKLKIRNDLVKKNGKDAETTIYAQYCFDGKIKLFNTGQKVLPDLWEGERVLKSDNYTVKNSIINKVKGMLEKIVQHAEFNNILPTLEYVEAKYNELAAPVDTGSGKESFLDVFDLFIEQRQQSRKYSAATIKQYRVARLHLESFAKATKFKLSFASMNHVFMEKYEAYLRGQDKRANTIGNQVKYVKTFLQWATDYGYNTNMDFRQFKKPREETEITVLSESDLQKLTDLDLSENARLERVRDLFLVGCYTGLRFSDLSNLEPESFEGDFIRVRTVKTDDLLRIPILPAIVPILEKYGYQLPKISGQKMNDYLKELGQLAQLDGTGKKYEMRNGLRVARTVNKAELLSTHCARRTFITLALKRGVPAATLIEITGHSDLQVMQRYVKITEQDTAAALRKAFGS
jgi:integrase